MIKINLLPTKVKGKAKKKKPTISPIAVIIGIILILLSLVLMGLLQIKIQRDIDETNNKIKSYEEGIRQLDEKVKKINSYEAQKKLLLQKLEIIENLKKAQKGPVQMLEQLSLSFPDKMWIDNFQNIGNSIKLRGFAIDESLIADFMDNLAKSNYFTDIKLERVSKVGVKYGFEVHDFEINMKIVEQKKPEVPKK